MVVGLTAEVYDNVFDRCIESGMAHVLSNRVIILGCVDFVDQVTTAELP